MSILGLFDIGKSALFASQTALGVTSNNIANVNTPGYSKEGIVLSVSSPVASGAGLIGRGVTVTSIARSFDRFIEAQLLGQGQSQSRSAALDQSWGQVEQIYNEAQGMGLSSSLADYFNAWNDVATNPASQPQRVILLQKAATLTTTAKSMERSILGTLSDANSGIADGATQVNMIAEDIAKLNNQIIQQEAGASGSSVDLRDQRDQKLTDLAKLVDYSTYEDKNGSVTVIVGMRNLVSGNRTNPLAAVRNSDGNQDLYLDNINITANIQSGKIGGLLAARSDIESTALVGLRKLVAAVTQQVNTLHQAGYGLDTSTGSDFFTPLQLSTSDNSVGADITSATIADPTLLTLDEYKITVSGGNLTVTNKQTGALAIPSAPYVSGGTVSFDGIDVVITGAATDGDSFTVSPLTTVIRDFNVLVTDPRSVAAASDPLQLPGDNGNALQIAQLTSTTQSTLGNATFGGYYGGVVSTVGVMKQTASDGLTFDNSLLSAIQARRDSVSGVSLDEEAANLIRYQRSYQAGARMITVADELLQTLLNL